MSMFTPAQNRRFAILHIFATVLTLLKAIDKFSHEKWLLGGVIAGLGLVMLAYTFLHHQIEEKMPLALPFFFLFEAIVLGLVAWANFDKGYFYLNVLSAVLYFGLFIRFYVVVKNKLRTH